jgi:hypothetical protein
VIGRCRIGRQMIYCQMRGKDAASNERRGGILHSTARVTSPSICLIGKALCYFYSRAGRLAFPIGKKPLFPYGGITVSDSSTH